MKTIGPTPMWNSIIFLAPPFWRFLRDYIRVRRTLNKVSKLLLPNNWIVNSADPNINLIFRLYFRFNILEILKRKCLPLLYFYGKQKKGIGELVKRSKNNDHYIKNLFRILCILLYYINMQTNTVFMLALLLFSGQLST